MSLWNNMNQQAILKTALNLRKFWMIFREKYNNLKFTVTRKLFVTTLLRNAIQFRQKEVLFCGGEKVKIFCPVLQKPCMIRYSIILYEISSFDKVEFIILWCYGLFHHAAWYVVASVAWKSTVPPPLGYSEPSWERDMLCRWHGGNCVNRGQEKWPVWNLREEQQM